jgi:hypothetical protein
LRVHVARELGEDAPVHLDAVPLHPGEHGDQRQLQLAREAGELGGLDVPPQSGGEPLHRLGSLAEGLGHLLGRAVTEAATRPARRRRVVRNRQLEVEALAGEVRQGVLPPRGVQEVREQLHIPVQALQLQPHPEEEQREGLGIVGVLGQPGVREQRTEHGP